MPIKIPNWPEIPQDVVEKLVSATKEKFPNADDTVVRELINSHIQTVREYFQGIQT